MKKTGLLLLAVVLGVCVVGCAAVAVEDSFTVEDMAGVYTPTKVTVVEGGVTTTTLSPDISGTLILTSAGAYAIDYTYLGVRSTGSGTFDIVDSTLVIDGSASGPISDDGQTFSTTSTTDGITTTYEFTRS
jgi:hypothetical protein